MVEASDSKSATNILKIPVPIELPKAEEREFNNSKTDKPANRKLKELDLKFGELTEKNLE